jgi:malate/lactate dehydrogenase
MRRKVTCTTTTRTGEIAALMIAQLDLAALVLLGEQGDDLASDLAGAAAAQGFEPRIRAGNGGWADAAGSDLVVLDAVADDTGSEIAARCAGAVVVVATGDPVADVARLLEETRLPRARIFGAVCDSGAEFFSRAAVATQLVDAVLRDRRRALDAVVQTLAPDGATAVVAARARIGAGGVQAIL